MIFWLILLAGVVAYVARGLVAKRARRSFCADGCVTLALRLKPGKRGFGWRHGYARRVGGKIEWRAEFKLGEGADLSFDLNDLRIDEHRPVRPGEAMLSELCELVFAFYRGERIELGIPRTELDTFLRWLDASDAAA
ncbi:MAG TPA: DUF2550 family protein [Frankiaceae bacterium]|nr:DUF2550 family protein [Frankiaceae bacterium]